jgi:hypothetical protein
MIVAICKVQLSRGYLGGWELEFTCFAFALSLFAAGGGMYPVDHALFPSIKMLRLFSGQAPGEPER